ncbi:MAG: hypothetical protein H6697_01130 [Myxococcales bacterium]|nr:hypothetical protein [Myxococcales bacterium]MCB9520541.1 hypothetical protein [Myxococcales bacterium]
MISATLRLARAAAASFVVAGFAAPALGAGLPVPETPNPDGALAVDLELYTTFSDVSGEVDLPSELTLDRAELGLSWTQPNAGAELRLRTLPPSSTTRAPSGGTATQSTAAKRAHGWVNIPLTHAADGSATHVLTLDGGLIAGRWVSRLQREYGFVAISPLVSQHPELLSTSALGASADWSGWGDRVNASLSLESTPPGVDEPNGQRVAVAATVVPVDVPFSEGRVRLALHGGLRQRVGDSPSSEERRVSGAVSLRLPCPSAGFEVVRADGVGGDPNRSARALSGWAASWLGTQWAGLFVRYDSVRTDVRVGGSRIETATFAAFSDLVHPRRVAPPIRARLIAGVQLQRGGTSPASWASLADAHDVARPFVTLDLRGHADFDYEGAQPAL